jgi:lysophospholipase L1-like esterase
MRFSPKTSIPILAICLFIICLLSLPLNLFAQDCSSNLLIDNNCDGVQKILVLGDSFVAGTGDTNLKTLKGYIGRTQKALPKFEITAFGVKGQQTGQLLTSIKEALAQASGSLYNSLLETDVVLLDLGRNDRWLFGLPKDALKNLQTIRSLIRKEVKTISGKSPVVVLAVLMLPNRGAQGPWVKELNTLIFKSHSTTNPANLRFDLVSKRLIGADQIHPTSRGYVELSKVFVKYIKKNLPSLVRKQSDSDVVTEVL